MDRIESVQNEKVKAWNKLKEKKYRDETGLFLVEGPHLVEEAIKNHQVREILSIHEEPYCIPTTLVTKEIMKKLTDQQTPPEMIGICQKLQPKEITGNILLLDGIQDPGNLGTILRSALAFGMKDILLSPECVDLYNPKVIRSTEGMFFNLNILREDLSLIIPKLKAKGYRILGTDVTNGKDIKKMEKISPYALIIGSEGKGLSMKIRDLCDEFLYIPMNPQAESLNAAVSASILLYETSRWKDE